MFSGRPLGAARKPCQCARDRLSLFRFKIDGHDIFRRSKDLLEDGLVIGVS